MHVIKILKKTFFILILGAFITLLPAQSFADTNALSMNWSGYEASSGNYSSVSSSWTVPTVSSPTLPSGDAAWIGIGGISSTDLIQTGTLEVIDSAHQGQVQYSAWYELLPASTVTIPLTINPGDSISASITEQTPNTWLISMKDITSGQSYQTTVDYTSSHSSAEWIEEMPTISNSSGSSQSFLPIDNFGSVQFTNATAVSNGTVVNLATGSTSEVVMGNRNNFALAVPSFVGMDGQSFTVNRTSASTDSENYIQTISPQAFNPGGRRFRTGTGVNPFGYGASTSGTSTGGLGRTFTVPFGNGTITIYFR